MQPPAMILLRQGLCRWVQSETDATWCKPHFAGSRTNGMGLICAGRRCSRCSRRSNWASYLAWQQHTGPGRKAEKGPGIGVLRWKNESHQHHILYAMFSPISFSASPNGLYPLWNVAVRKKVDDWLVENTDFSWLKDSKSRKTAKKSLVLWKVEPRVQLATNCGQVTTRASAALPHRRRTLPCAVLGIQLQNACPSKHPSICFYQLEVAMG